MALRRLPGHGREPSISRVHAESRDAVMPTVRDVDEVTRPRDFDLGRGIAAHERVRHRRDYLNGLKFAALGIPGIGGDGGIELVAHIGAKFGWMEGEVTRSGSAARCSERRIA